MELPIADIALTFVAGLGVRHRDELAELCGGAEAYFAASADQLRDLGLAGTFIRGRDTAYNQALSVAEFCTKHNVRALAKSRSNYPLLLAQCPDAPTVLYCRGEVDFTKLRAISVVGTRRITFDGDALCQKIVGDLLDGIPDLTIVSGLALGVDASAHRATVSKKRSTIAVMPGWVDDIAPRSHFGLARDILAAGGAIVSEQPPGSAVVPQSFVIRNRIVAGLSSATLVIQSAVKGGSMITAEMTLGYDRELFTVAGDGSEAFEGNRKLIKTSQAQLIDNATEIADYLGWNFFADKNSAVAEGVEAIPDDLRGLYGALPEAAAVTVDEVAELLEMPLGTLNAMLMRLEILGLIRTSKGRLIRKTGQH